MDLSKVAPDIQRYFANRSKIEEWLQNKKPDTIKLYLTQLKRFEQTTHTTLETLLDQLENRNIKPTEIRTLITQATKPLKNPSQVMTDATIRSFFKHWWGELPTTTIKYDQQDNFKPYSKAQLQQLIGYIRPLLAKLFITIAAESGLRAEAIIQLKYHHIKQDLNNRTGSIALDLESSFHKGRKKSGYTFIGTRARELIKQAIEGNLINTQDDSNLFTFTQGAIRSVIKRARRKFNLNDPLIHPIHSTRPYFKDQLITAGIDPALRKMLEGRFNDTDAKSYTRRDSERLRPEYEHAYPHLDIMNNTPEQTQELTTRQTELQDTVTKLSQRIQLLEHEKQQITQLKNRPTQQLLETLAPLPDETLAVMLLNFIDHIRKTRQTQALLTTIPSTGSQISPKPPSNIQ